MATRGSISIFKDGKVLTTYTHWDSYLSGKGATLLEHHNTEEAANRIIQLGNSSTINERLDDLPNGWTFDNRPSFTDEKAYEEYSMYSVFYGRDRGEPGQEAREYSSWEKAMEVEAQEYNYLWKDGKWWVKSHRIPLTELTEELIQNND